MFPYTFFFLIVCISGACSTLDQQRRQKDQRIEYTENNAKITCDFPFQPIGAFCGVIDNIILGSWSEALSYCQSLGGDLVDLKDANRLYDIFLHLNANDLTNVSYWVGANDLDSEGSWVWASDNSPVKMGTPLWGLLYGREPDGGSAINCGMLSIDEFFYLHDTYCSSLKGVICQAGNTTETGSTGFQDIQPKACPPDYVNIGNTCLNIFPQDDIWSFTWYAAKAFCESQGAHLLKYDDANLLGLVYDYLTANGIKSYLFVDGTDEETEDVWLFHDGAPVKRGTPFWRVFTPDVQAPSGSVDSNCIFIQSGFSYTLENDLCTHNHGLICQYDD